MEDSYSVEHIKRLCVFMFQTSQNSEPQNGPRSGLDYIALGKSDVRMYKVFAYILKAVLRN